MKLKLLLLFLGIANLLFAQEPYRNLVITEARMIEGDYVDCYFELTNMGDSDIDLSDIKFANMGPQGEPVLDVWNDPWTPAVDRYFFLPESVTKVLKPGESYVMTIAYDFGQNMYNMRMPGYGFANRAKHHDIYPYADFLAHRDQKDAIELVLYPNVKDSVTIDPDSVYWDGATGNNYVPTIGFAHLPQIGFYIEHHTSDIDSFAIDQVGNGFEDEGTNDGTSDDVAGVTSATTTALLVRKSVIKQGNLDFNNSRGVGLDDSEWMAVTYPEGIDNWRDTWWSVGNHGAYVLDANTLESDVINVDFAGKTITVPWGIRRLDDVMRNMKRKPGVAWIYNLNESKEDSLMRSAQTGDKLTVYVFGETLYWETFDIKVAEPTANSNIVVPIDHANLDEGAITFNSQHGILNWPRVTKHENGIDTITGGGYGLPFALRVDSLFKYLEKPVNASWEIVPVDGGARADLKTGDKLKVTAQDGTIKEYFIETQGYVQNNNASLASITWPDISLDPFYQDIFGWKGDTIPNFTPATTNFRVTLPYDHEGIPALVAKTDNLNATVAVDRATTFEGSIEDRTTSFEVTAEDDTSKIVYNVELAKEKNPANVQPYFAEPFVSEMIVKTNGNNNFVEICNPGNQVIDLSNYMFCSSASVNPADAITQQMDPLGWSNRYAKYVPGYKWVNEAEWAISPGILEQDLNVNQIVLPGDVFCFGTINNDNHLTPDMQWHVPMALNVQFWIKDLTYDSYTNPWNEPVSQAPVVNTFTKKFYMFKILNDSVKSGLKPANDPNDFELIDAMGMADGGRWYVGGVKVLQRTNYKRKPELIKGNPVLESSFGENEEDSEWIIRNATYYGARGIGQTDAVHIMESDLGQHFFIEPSQYMSTVTAVVYKVSKGYSLNESILGILNGTTVSEFMVNIYKADEGQALKVNAFADGSELNMDAILSLNDTLVVMSADSTNTTKYVLNVAEVGLSADAVLTSSRYEITIETEPKSAVDENAGNGNINGLEYGTTLKSVVGSINVPAGATLTVIDGDGAFVPFKVLNFDTTYVSVTVNNDIYFEVVAENGTTKIIYQLIPESTDNDALITSDVYDVVQKDILIQYVPRGTNVQALIGNLVASEGATIKLVDKMGNERTIGSIVQDDKVVVTSRNGLNSKAYFISMLATQYVPETTYLAYIQSSVYGIDQVDNMVHGVPGTEAISDFLSKIKASEGATAVVVDENGAEKTSGDIDNGDMVMVTSLDGQITVYYSFGTLTSSNMYDTNNIDLYPNPTNGDINVSGVKAGNRIQVYNSVGAIIRDIKVQSNIERISLHNQPTGMYMIVISDNNKLLGRYKALRK